MPLSLLKKYRNRTRIKKEKDPTAYSFIHNFLPHPHHKTRARLLSSKALTMYIMALGFFVISLHFIPKVAPGVLGYASDINMQDLLNYTNKERESAGLKPLRVNPSLTKAAELKAQDMFENNYWSHVSPAGKEPWDFILGQEYDYSYAGENLAKNFNDSKGVVNAWMKSPSHRENLLSGNYDEIGFAIVNGTLDGYKTTLVVQMFGRPRDPAFLASSNDERAILDQASTSVAALAPDTQGISTEQSVQHPTPLIQNTPLAEKFQPIIFESPDGTKFLSMIDARNLTKTVSVVFGGFITSLLGLDVWYSKRKSIPKFTGHTLAHLTVLILALVGVWFLFTPGRVI
jgi:hypothetical protein